MGEILIRAAGPQDVGTLLQLIRELAEFEKLSHEVRATEADLLREGFGPTPRYEALLAEEDGRALGFALFFHNFSTFEGKPGIYLEDLFVRSEARGAGLGKALLVHLAKLAVERGCARLEWWVLDWNAPAIGFYEKLGARAMDDWTVMRVEGAALAGLAAQK